MTTIRIEEINRTMREGNGIAREDARITEQLRVVAKEIADHREERPLILLSGPSGSGKTTTAMMLERLLDENGCETHTLSMDHYFHSIDLEKQPNLDLESPLRLDTSLLNEQLMQIAACETVKIPHFDFVTNTRREGRSFTRKHDEPVILEGIHALNPDVVRLPDEKTVRLYVSVRTRVETEDGQLVHPESIRLLRRLLRDKRYRGRSFEDTLRRYASVQNGEKQYILPYKYRSTYDIDTFLSYEIGTYRALATEELLMLRENAEARALVQLLCEAEEIAPSSIPSDSLIREFIGDGKFKY